MSWANEDCYRNLQLLNFSILLAELHLLRLVWVTPINYRRIMRSTAGILRSAKRLRAETEKTCFDASRY